MLIIKPPAANRWRVQTHLVGTLEVHFVVELLDRLVRGVPALEAQFSDAASDLNSTRPASFRNP